MSRRHIRQSLALPLLPPLQVIMGWCPVYRSSIVPGDGLERANFEEKGRSRFEYFFLPSQTHYTWWRRWYLLMRRLLFRRDIPAVASSWLGCFSFHLSFIHHSIWLHAHPRTLFINRQLTHSSVQHKVFLFGWQKEINGKRTTNDFRNRQCSTENIPLRSANGQRESIIMGIL